MYYILYSICCISSVVSNSFQPHGLHSPWNSPGQNAGVDNHSILQGIFPTQGSNPGLRHCRRIRFQLSHKGSLRILEWVAYPFSSRSSRPRNQTRVSCIAGRFSTNWAIREAQKMQTNPCDRKRSVFPLRTDETSREKSRVGARRIHDLHGLQR